MKENEVVRLSDNNKYIVLKTTNVSGKDYACLLKVGKEADFYIVEKRNNELYFIEDEEEKLALISIMGVEFSEN